MPSLTFADVPIGDVVWNTEFYAQFNIWGETSLLTWNVNIYFGTKLPFLMELNAGHKLASVFIQKLLPAWVFSSFFLVVFKHFRCSLMKDASTP